MPDDKDQIAEDQVAEKTSSPDVTDDGASSSEAEVELTAQEAVMEEFLETYGEKEDEAETDEESSSEPKDAKSDDEADTDKAEAKPEENDAPADQDQEKESTRLSEKEYEALSPKVQRRMSELSSRVKEASQERDAYRDGHERFQKFNTYIQENSLEADDITTGLNAMAHIRAGRSAEALKILAPVVNQLQIAVGEVLPADLQKLVDDGDVTVEAASLQSRDRAVAAQAQAENQRLQSQNEALSSGQAKANADDKILQHANTLDAKLREEDPDYDRKSAAIEKQVALQVSRKFPENEQEFELIVRGAHEFVSSLMPPEARPDPKPTTRRPSASSPSRSTPGEFKTTLGLLEANPYQPRG